MLGDSESQTADLPREAKAPQDRGDAAPRPESPIAAPARRADAAPAAPPAANRKRRGRAPLILLGAAVLGVIAWFGHGWWTVGRFQVGTDDAYVNADFAVMAARVSGYVERVLVTQNAHVRAGEPLVALEDGDYRNALEAAQARISAQHATLTRLDRQIEAARAAVAQAEAKGMAARAMQTQASLDFQRFDRLAKSDFASGQQLEAARAARATAEADVADARAGVASAQAAVAVARAQRVEADAAMAGLAAALERAERDLAAATVLAPFDGVIGNLSVARGDYVAPGSRLLAVVPLGAVYIEANFKETQLAGLAPGAPVTVHVDAFPDRDFVGHVDSFSPAVGSVFSLLPPENATGNFTKVVQRVPVRVSVPAEVAAQGWLRPGMSVVATADSRAAAATR